MNVRISLVYGPMFTHFARVSVHNLHRKLSWLHAARTMTKNSFIISYDFFKSLILHSARFEIKDGIALHASCSVMSGLVATSALYKS